MHLLETLLGPVERAYRRRTQRRLDQEAEKITKHLANTTRDSTLQDLGKVLGEILGDSTFSADGIFATFATPGFDGNHTWREGNFITFLATRLGNSELLTACGPFLWRIFIQAARYPFVEDDDARQDDNVLACGPEAFRRAFSLLSLRGWDLFGAKRDGEPLGHGRAYYNQHEFSYGAKISRLTRTVYQSLSTSSVRQPLINLEAIRDLLEFSDIKDTLLFTQPLVIDQIGCFISKNMNPKFDTASTQLMMQKEATAAAKYTPRSLRKVDLQQLIQLLLLVRIEDEVWMTGVWECANSQRSCGLRYARLQLDTANIAMASHYARTVVASNFGDDEMVPLDTFQAWCAKCPYFIFSFFQFWATMFASGTLAPTSLDNEPISMKISLINFLCFQNAVSDPYNKDFASKYYDGRWHEQELRLHLGLCNAQLMTNLFTQPDLKASDLQSVFSSGKFSPHILLIHGQDLQTEGESGRKATPSVALLTIPSPSHSQKQEVRHRGESQVLTYVWRTPVVPLESNLTTQACSGQESQMINQARALVMESMRDSLDVTFEIDVSERIVDIFGSHIQAEALSPQSLNSEGGSEILKAAGAHEILQMSGRVPVLGRLRLRLSEIDCYPLPDSMSGWLRGVKN